MVKKQGNKKSFYIKSIYVGEEDFDIDKEVNKMAKKDPNIPKEIVNKRSSMVSYITVKLWKQYIKIQKRIQSEDEGNK